MLAANGANTSPCPGGAVETPHRGGGASDGRVQPSGMFETKHTLKTQV